MDNLNLIRKKFEKQINKKIYSVHQYENVPNNNVFRIETNSRPYIFKVYTNDWPEDGKLRFIDQKLTDYKIPHAKIFVFSRDDVDFANGYLIEECLTGTTADRLTLSVDETITLFGKLGTLVSQIHQIKMINYGYIGSGIADYTTFSEFMHDSFYDNVANLKTHNLIDATELETVGREIQKRLKVCDKFPSILCHGDLSTKNILVDTDEITLIDWDDAYSLCWLADIASLTLWMKLEYGDNAVVYRKAFLDNYETKHDKNAFYEVEDILHIRYGLDAMSYYIGKPQYNNMKEILQKSFHKCNMQRLKCLKD